MIVVAIVQMILHYLGWLGIIAGVIAFLFGNTTRGSELLIGGLGFIVLKYVIGFVFVGLRGSKEKADSKVAKR
jgi:hypothetical protein